MLQKHFHFFCVLSTACFVLDLSPGSFSDASISSTDTVALLRSTIAVPSPDLQVSWFIFLIYFLLYFFLYFKIDSYLFSSYSVSKVNDDIFFTFDSWTMMGCWWTPWTVWEVYINPRLLQRPHFWTRRSSLKTPYSRKILKTKGWEERYNKTRSVNLNSQIACYNGSLSRKIYKLIILSFMFSTFFFSIVKSK